MLTETTERPIRHHGKGKSDWEFTFRDVIKVTSGGDIAAPICETLYQEATFEFVKDGKHQRLTIRVDMSTFELKDVI